MKTGKNKKFCITRVRKMLEGGGGHFFYIIDPVISRDVTLSVFHNISKPIWQI